MPRRHSLFRFSASLNSNLSFLFYRKNVCTLHSQFKCYWSEYFFIKNSWMSFINRHESSIFLTCYFFFGMWFDIAFRVPILKSTSGSFYFIVFNLHTHISIYNHHRTPDKIGLIRFFHLLFKFVCVVITLCYTHVSFSLKSAPPLTIINILHTRM